MWFIAVKVVGDANISVDERCRTAGLLQQVMLKADMIGLVQHDRLHSIMALLHSSSSNASPALLTTFLKMVLSHYSLHVQGQTYLVLWLC